MISKDIERHSFRLKDLSLVCNPEINMEVRLLNEDDSVSEPLTLDAMVSMRDYHVYSIDAVIKDGEPSLDIIIAKAFSIIYVPHMR